ncbi:MAG TPA: S1C family serine protease [Candidatus Methylomirabilis sp.]|nr:S1C family serine protease [Candidatus Methylomirabilis sp.]
MSVTARVALVGAAVWLLAVLPTPAAQAATETELQSAVFRAKPAVVMVAVRIGATATVRCASGATATARPGSIGELGSGSIIHPDGWIVTNGHVVQPYQEGIESAFAGELLEKAVASACAAELDTLPAPARSQQIRALAASTENRRGLALERMLTINLSNGKSYPAVVKFYSPPAYVIVRTGADAAGAPRQEHGRDVAILKIQDKELPVVRLARHSTDLHLGQELFVIGFPGVVTSHELLSQATRFEPSITTGRVSGFKEDIGGQRVIQTDAAIIQGNSGGPVFDDRGQVIGAATFTSFQGEQVVQGFNFLIPVETIQDAARQAGLTPRGDSMFTRLWNHGVDLYIRDLHYRAYRNMSAADRIHPGFPDVERVREDCDIKHKEQGYLHREEVQWGVMGVGLLGALAVVWFGGRRAVAAARASVRRIVREELEKAGGRSS